MGVNGLVVFRNLYPLLRWLGWSALVVYVVIAFVILGLRYVLIPNIDHYKPVIEAQLSRALGNRVELGAVTAQWRGLNPQITMRKVRLTDDQEQPVLSVPYFQAAISWRSLLTMTPHFTYLRTTGVDLTVRRDKRGRMWLLGRTLDAEEPSDRYGQTDEAYMSRIAIAWLSSQPQISLTHSALTWIDEARSAQPLRLQDVNLIMRNQGKRHQFSLMAQSQSPSGSRLDVRGDLQRAPGAEHSLAMESGQGRMYVKVDGIRPRAWRAWMDWPDWLSSEWVSGQAWLDINQGTIQTLTADVNVHQARLNVTDDGQIYSDQVRFFIKTTVPTWLALAPSASSLLVPALAETARVHHEEVLDFSVQAQGLRVRLDELYDRPLMVDVATARGVAGQTDSGLFLRMNDLQIRNQDIDTHGDVMWQDMGDNGPGRVDAKLAIRHIRLGAVHRYMPKTVDADLRDWLQHGLQGGQFYSGEMVLRGDLSQFPFDENEPDGEFYIRGPYQDAIVDYAPEIFQGGGWPRLEAMKGELDLHGNSLHIHADAAQITPAADLSLQLADVDARITDLSGSAVLTINGDTRGDGSAYMAFVRHSPVRDMLDRVFDQTQATGAWHMPLQLTIPLADVDDTRVNGVIRINQGDVQFIPALPLFSAVTGEVSFTENIVETSGVSAIFLGEAVQVSGGIGPKQAGLRMTGQVGAQALSELIQQTGMARLSGRTSYMAHLKDISQDNAGQSLQLTISSDLVGLAMDFPIPMAKTADQVWPLHISWAPGGAASSRVLEVSLEDRLQARFVHDPSQSGSYFQTGSIGLGRSVDMRGNGLNVEIQHPVFDGDAWDSVIKEFSDVGSAATAVFPPLQALRLQTEEGRILGLPMQALTYTLVREGVNDWRAVISSTETAGSVSWTESDGAVAGPVKAVFHRLAFGDDKEDEAGDAGISEAAALVSGHDELRIPAINLVVDNLTFYGHPVGKLVLVGVNQTDGQAWQLEQFSLSSPSAYLQGKGVWTLRGPHRGLKLDAHVDISDLGDYFKQLGYDEVLAGGEGMAQGQIEWLDLPWSFDRNRINGHIEFQLEKGRLNTPDSKSARLLELISLQSFKRLSTLDLNPLPVMKDGFPFDVLRGELSFDQGQLQTRDYRIIGPVGTVVLDGGVALTTGKLDLQAVVAPNLDVSGAALAAGIALNPVVGVGAFLTQWLLKSPLEKAMATHYQIHGDWDEPEITEVERLRTEPPAAPDH